MATKLLNKTANLQIKVLRFLLEELDFALQSVSRDIAVETS
jgi:hypothetical protein